MGTSVRRARRDPGMLRCGSAFAAHSSGTTVLPGSDDLSNFSGRRSKSSLMQAENSLNPSITFA
jgi:hypothetical protein